MGSSANTTLLDVAGVVVGEARRLLVELLSVSVHDRQWAEKVARPLFARFEISIGANALCTAPAEFRTGGPAAGEAA